MLPTRSSLCQVEPIRPGVCYTLKSKAVAYALHGIKSCRVRKEVVVKVAKSIAMSYGSCLFVAEHFPPHDGDVQEEKG